ncbi:MAG: ATP-dependent Clp protease proteolytic subunit, partial [Spirochaetaceae bacterium]|nr:ATP-dependent Clp protease proteolytic subunit [Spirochaetaceae bacterium]
FAVYNAIKNYKGEVTIIINALAASAAAYLVFAADKIKIYDNSVFMIHRAWNMACGNAKDLEEQARMLGALDGIIAADYAAATGKSKEEALAAMEKDVWLIGADAILAHGIKAERIDYEKEDDKAKIDEARARTRYMAMVDKLKTAADAVPKAKILALLNNKPALNAGRGAKAMTKEELLELLGADEDLKKAVIEWAKEQEGVKPDEPPPAAAADPEPPAEDDPKKEPPAENKAAAQAKRCAEILALAGGVMTDRAKAAIESGMSAADFMVSETIAEKRALALGASNTGSIGRPSAPQTFAALAGKKKTDDPQAAVTDDDELRAMAKRM